MNRIQLKTIVYLLCLCLSISSCGQNEAVQTVAVPDSATTDIMPAAHRTAAYYPLLKEKQIALVVNHSSRIGQAHLVDSLLAAGIDIKRLFAPEHGFRGDADAGAQIKDGKDVRSGLSIVSLYGKKKKPTSEDLRDIDLLVFDIQDVGARFYTYISTLHYVMEACAEYDVPLLLLDRPNPNGHHVDGPILSPDYKSFVGMHPIPIVHGLTIGELAKMINGEGWLSGGRKCDLTVVPCQNYTHQSEYTLPVPPSPNLPNQKAIYLYPSLCLFEGTTVSVGRGTDKPFQQYGHPDFRTTHTFTPAPNKGASHPKWKGQTCYGYDLGNLPIDSLYTHGFRLDYLLQAYATFPDKQQFFNENNFFDKLAGTEKLRQQIKAGMSESNIRKSWEPGLSQYKVMRRRYLLHPE